jgi:hypothetical protein
MSLALTNMRGACLNCLFAVNGIQKARKSLGVAVRRLDISLPFCLSALAAAVLAGRRIGYRHAAQAPRLRSGNPHFFFRSPAKLAPGPGLAFACPAIAKSSFQYFDRLVKITGSPCALKGHCRAL